MVIEFLAVKGLIWLHKIIIAKGIGTLVTSRIVQLIGTYGLSAVIEMAVTIGVIAGGIKWSREKLGIIINAIKAIEEDRLPDAARYFGDFIKTTRNVSLETLPDKIQELLDSIGVDSEKIQMVIEVIRTLEGPISQYLNEKRNS